jgi:hypothetical protein
LAALALRCAIERAIARATTKEQKWRPSLDLIIHEIWT